MGKVIHLENSGLRYPCFYSIRGYIRDGACVAAKNNQWIVPPLPREQRAGTHGNGETRSVGRLTLRKALRHDKLRDRQILLRQIDADPTPKGDNHLRLLLQQPGTCIPWPASHARRDSGLRDRGGRAGSGLAMWKSASRFITCKTGHQT